MVHSYSYLKSDKRFRKELWEEKKDKKLTVAEFNKELNKRVKEKSEEYLELINKAETCGYDFNKFKNEINSKGDLNKKKAINKMRKKLW